MQLTSVNPPTNRMDFAATLDFLAEFRWMFDFKVTEILTDEYLERIPQDWFSYLKKTPLKLFNKQVMRQCYEEENVGDDDCVAEELDNFNQDVVVDDAPDFVKLFVSQLKSLNVKFPTLECTSRKLSAEESRGLSDKKKHEILNFSDFLIRNCSERGVTNMADVGSGLGYIDTELAASGINVLGIEANTKFHEAAVRRYDEIKRKKQQYQLCQPQQSNQLSGEIRHVNMTFDFSPQTLEMIKSEAGASSCMIGLHACGDLTPQIFRVVAASENIRSLCIVSCCYHKMKNKDNFPLSKELKEVSMSKGISFFNQYFLRLASQETIARWWSMTTAEHEQHCKNVVFRAILEIFAKQKGIVLQKSRRKAVRKEDVVSFPTFINSANTTYQLQLSEEEEKQLLQLFEEKRQLENLVENLTGCQYLIQGLIEALILIDRVSYLEQELDLDVSVSQIFQPTLSPRNKVVHAVKRVS